MALLLNSEEGRMEGGKKEKQEMIPTERLVSGSMG